ncbi:hypothetical protein V8F20_001194 [Naviculisporaceae sp. PSN 640]
MAPFLLPSLLHLTYFSLVFIELHSSPEFLFSVHNSRSSVVKVPKTQFTSRQSTREFPCFIKCTTISAIIHIIPSIIETSSTDEHHATTIHDGCVTQRINQMDLWSTRVGQTTRPGRTIRLTAKQLHLQSTQILVNCGLCSKHLEMQTGPGAIGGQFLVGNLPKGTVRAPRQPMGLVQDRLSPAVGNQCSAFRPCLETALTREGAFKTKATSYYPCCHISNQLLGFPTINEGY